MLEKHRPPLLSPPSSHVLAVALSLLVPGAASAFCLYNSINASADVKVLGGDFSSNVSAGANACCHWSNKDCNPAGTQGAMLRAQFEVGTFNCVVPLQAGGYASVEQEDRSHLRLPPNYYCKSFTHDHQLIYQSNYGVGFTKRDVRFLVTGDPQYQNSGDNSTANQTLATMVNAISQNPQVRGMVVAGDLTQNTRPRDEFASYKRAISGMSRFVYDGIGNHDQHEATFAQQFACGLPSGMDSTCVDRVEIQNDIHERKRSTVLTLRGNPHYSWDWHDIHFVQLNLFPGTEASPTRPEHSPKDSLVFLMMDLAFHVGTSGRPVVLIHHYGFDPFSTGEENGKYWWTEAQRVAYWDAIASYNVIAIFTGHNHRGPGSPFQEFFYRPAGRISGPDRFLSFVSGAATSGAYLDVMVDDAALTLTQKDSHGTPTGMFAQIPFRNLALNKPATQSSLLNDAQAWKAVDGNTDGVFPNLSVTHTLGAPQDPQPWWMVDLEAQRWIGSVVLHNRTDCCAERLSNFKLMVSADGTTWHEFPHPGQAGTVTRIPVRRSGRYVKVQLLGGGPLSLAEVEVFE
ncbi:discoidin domain-containing protein [Myxococcus sp. Y35]|uniref:galactose-binding domain-containing protein n=1 Tax=Pseudomyxococcus flavus TaxID=3115648 RepID=UPI003CF8C9DA